MASSYTYPKALVTLYTLFFGKENEEPEVVSLPPQKVTWTRNNVREADEVEIEIDTARLPGFDPRAIYAMRVEVRVADTRSLGSPITGADYNRRFLGFIDNASVRDGDDEGSLVLTGRDYTSILADRKVPRIAIEPSSSGGQYRFDPKTYPLDSTLADFVDLVLADSGEVDLFRGNILIHPTLAEINLQDRLGLSEWPVDSGDSLWDVLNKVTDLLGGIPEVRLDQLHIQTANALSGRIFHLAWGQNIAELEMTKDLTAGVSRKIFAVVGFNPRADTPEEQITIGSWPPNRFTEYAPSTKTSKSASPGRKPKKRTVNDPTVRYHVEGRYPVETLTAMARTFYERACRNDIQGSIQTSAMEDLGFDVSRGDWMPPVEPRIGADGFEEIVAVGRIAPSSLLDMANADTILLERNPNAITGAREKSQAEILKELTEAPHHLPYRIASLIATSMKQGQTKIRVLYVKQAKHTWDNENGYDLDIEFTSVIGTDVEGSETPTESDAFQQLGLV